MVYLKIFEDFFFEILEEMENFLVADVTQNYVEQMFTIELELIPCRAEDSSG